MKRTAFSSVTSTGKGHSLRILRYRKSVLAAALTVILILFTSHGAAAQPDNDKWHFSITPYLWAPNIDGTLSFDTPQRLSASPNVEVGPNSYLENLDFAVMLAAEVRKKRWSVFTDLIYLDFSSEKSTVKSANFIGPGVFPRRPLWKSVQDWTQELSLL